MKAGQQFQFKADHVRELLTDTVAGLEVEDGDIQLFSAALLMAAIQSHLDSRRVIRIGQ